MLFLAAMATLSGTMWGLTHWAAEPGTPVKVLFGLTEYTKSAPRPNPVAADEVKAALGLARLTASAPTSGDKGSPSESKPTRTIEVFHGIGPDAAEKFLTSTRNRLAVRELSPMETGGTLGEAPKGTWFYIPTIWLDTAQGPQALRNLERAKIFKESYRSLAFEAYHLGGGELFMLVFTTEAEAVGARTLNGRIANKLLASPMPWGASTSALLVPVSRIVSMKSRELEVGVGSRISAADTVLE